MDTNCCALCRLLRNTCAISLAIVEGSLVFAVTEMEPFLSHYVNSVQGLLMRQHYGFYNAPSARIWAEQQCDRKWLHMWRFRWRHFRQWRSASPTNVTRKGVKNEVHKDVCSGHDVTGHWRWRHFRIAYNAIAVLWMYPEEHPLIFFFRLGRCPSTNQRTNQNMAGLWPRWGARQHPVQIRLGEHSASSFSRHSVWLVQV